MTASAAVSPADFAATALLGECSEELIATLVACSRVRALRRHQVLFVHGDAADSLVIVRSGRLKVYAPSSTGDELLLMIAVAGETLGEVGVLGPDERSATVEAMEPAEVVLVQRDAFMRALDSDPALSRRLQLRIAALTRKMTASSTDLAFVDLPRRLAKALLEFAGAGGAARVEMSQSDLASYVGGSRQTVNAALTAFERRGWVDLEGGRAASLDVAALRQFAEG